MQFEFCSGEGFGVSCGRLGGAGRQAHIHIYISRVIHNVRLTGNTMHGSVTKDGAHSKPCRCRGEGGEGAHGTVGWTVGVCQNQGGLEEGDVQPIVLYHLRRQKLLTQVQALTVRI